ncbi:Ectonucleoside triphosphate diphosphohydrolase 6 [Schistosoma japonicum]|nr:Ectonucleoside triphosphate diphosphohydrolase 6 [Schistosoma japonicum]
MKFLNTEYDNNLINNSDTSPLMPIAKYQRLFTGLRPPSYFRPSYHRILRRVVYICISITLISFLWLAFYISDSTWFSMLLQCYHGNKFTGGVSISPYPLFIHTNSNDPKRIATSVTTTENYVYGVVFDAGSTGSRVHIFKLIYNPLDSSKPFTLLDDNYHHIKPGLSSYAEKPEEAASSLTKLINIAETSLPRGVCRDTPVMLRATAGLRLISSHKAENILKAVRHRLSQTCFKQLPNTVTIMDGFYEGLYLWITLNFLNDRLSHRKVRQNKITEDSLTNTIGTLDLGGGSTQITFIPTEVDTFNNAPSGFITYFDGQKHNIKDNLSKQKIYSHSYLGLGLMSARYSMLHNATGHFKSINEGKKEFFHPCWPSNVTLKWNHAGQDWLISRMNLSMSKSLLSSIKAKSIYHQQTAVEAIHTDVADNYDNDHPMLCYALALTVLQNPVEGDVNITRYAPNNNIVHQPAEVKTREFYAFSYYFDLATSAGLIHEDTGGFLTVNDFQHAAERICRNPDPEKPFDCMDLSFITALLHNGYGFPLDKKIGFFKKVKSFEINWSLGALFSEMFHKLPV